MFSLHKTKFSFRSYLNLHKSMQTKAKQLPQNQTICEGLPVFMNAKNHTDRIAIRDLVGNYTYANLFISAKQLSKELTQQLQGKPSQRVVFLCPNDSTYVITQWAIWMSGQIGVPVSTMHPQNVLEYYVNDCEAKLLVTTSKYKEVMQRIAKSSNSSLYVLDDKLSQNAMQQTAEKQGDMEGGLSYDFYNRSNAMILYTSGTTGKPKGVVLTHKNINSQASSLIDAWKWTSNDSILHTLPLHHVHGIVNALLCPLYVGAKCVMLPKFDETMAWSYLLGVNNLATERRISVFMAVPTIYARLIAEYERVFSADPKMVDYVKATLKNKVRLMISGSAPLPIPLFDRWLAISGHKLLERYGMTEIGMCLSNVYESAYVPGHVGLPLPGVTVRIASKPKMDNEGDHDTLLECSNSSAQEVKFKKSYFANKDPVGELFVKSNNVFKEYYNKPVPTTESFTLDGYFKTGDICQYSNEHKSFKILGRKSVDIIKSGGFKISALEVETRLLAHPLLKDCAVFGLPDDTWGERVVAIVSLKPSASLTYEELKSWAKQAMPEYEVPKNVKFVEAIPRNAMGKVNKKDVAKIYVDL